MTIADCCSALSLALCAPPAFWAAQGVGGAFTGRAPTYGPGALLLAGAGCAALVFAWLWPPDGLERTVGADGPLCPPEKAKAPAPEKWRRELCSSIVSDPV